MLRRTEAIRVETYSTFVDSLLVRYRHLLWDFTTCPSAWIVAFTARSRGPSRPWQVHGHTSKLMLHAERGPPTAVYSL